MDIEFLREEARAMLRDDKNIITATYRDESWVDPKAVTGTEAERFAHLKKVLLNSLMKEIDKSGNVVIEEVESYFYKIYVTEYKASVAVMPVKEYKRLKSIDANYKKIMSRRSGQEESE